MSPADERVGASDWAIPDAPAEPQGQLSARMDMVEDRPHRSTQRAGPIRTPIPLHPASVPELLDGGFETLRLRPQAIIATSALFTLPVQALLLWLSRTSGSGASASQSAGSFDWDAIGVGELVVLMVGGGFSLAWTTASVSLLVSSWYAGFDRSMMQVVIAAAKKSHVLAGAWILAHVLQLIIGLAGGITIVIGSALTLAVSPAIMVEEIGPVDAVKRSVQLARGQLGRSIGFVLLSATMVLTITPVLAVIPWFVVGRFDVAGEWLVSAAVAAAGVILVNSVLSAATTLFYLDMRVRIEGVDLVLQLPDRFDRRNSPR